MSGGFPWRMALFISIALNLIVLSMAVGAYIAGARLQRPVAEQMHPQLPRTPSSRAFMGALSPDARRAVRERLLQNGPALRAAREAALRARQHVFEVARQEPYDAAAVKQAFAAMRAADAALTTHFHDNVADALAQLSAVDRRTALDAARALPDPPEGDTTGATAPASEQRPPAATERRRERLQRWRERRRAQESTP